jgi:hypothetical protein
MSTVIYFGEGNLAITVSEEPDQVAEAFVEANGRSFKLTDIHGEELYVNPWRIAFWRDANRAPRPPYPPAPPVPSGRPPAPSERSPRAPRRLVLRYNRLDQSTTNQIYTLEQLLPEPLTVGSSSADYWVSYPDWFDEVKAREEVRKAIDTAELDLLELDD